ncbi:hypothetical protein Efla_004409 [Eimeria flavescens]
MTSRLPVLLLLFASLLWSRVPPPVLSWGWQPATVYGSALQPSWKKQLPSARRTPSVAVGSPWILCSSSVALNRVGVPALPTSATMLRSFIKLTSAKGPLQIAMEEKVGCWPSSAHKGHVGNPAPSLTETHFTLRIRSDKFRGKTLVQQHRLIYDVLREELSQGLHALSIKSGEPDAADSQ